MHRKLGTTQLHQPYQHHQVSLTHAAVDLYRIIQRTLSMQSVMILPFTGSSVLRFFGMYPAMGVALYRLGVMDNLAR